MLARRAEDAVEDHLASGDAVAGPDGVVVRVGFVDVHEYGLQLLTVVGNFEYVVLSVADEVWNKALGHRAYGRYVAGRILRLIGRLRRAEDVVELLLDSRNQPIGGRGMGGFETGLALLRAGVVRRAIIGFI